MKNNHLFFSLVLSVSVMATFGVWGASNPQIVRLLTQKQQKMNQLEQCAKKVNGFKIAGISTLGLTAVGVGGNVALASKKKSLDTEIDVTKTKIEKEEQKLADINAKIAAEKAKQKNPESANPEPVVQEPSTDGKDFVLYCKDVALCEFKGGKVVPHSDCNSDFDLKPGNPIFVGFGQPNICYTKLREMQGRGDICDYDFYIFATEVDSEGHMTQKGEAEGGHLFYCRESGEVIKAYEQEKPYDEKKCTSTFGKWNGTSCECHSSLRMLDGECLCPTDSPFKYPVADPWTKNANSCYRDWYAEDEIKSTACNGTGGRILSDGSCKCPSTMVLDKAKNICNCVSGGTYIDPERKKNGCKMPL